MGEYLVRGRRPVLDQFPWFDVTVVRSLRAELRESERDRSLDRIIVLGLAEELDRLGADSLRGAPHPDKLGVRPGRGARGGTKQRSKEAKKNSPEKKSNPGG